MILRQHYRSKFHNLLP